MRALISYYVTQGVKFAVFRPKLWSTYQFRSCAGNKEYSRYNEHRPTRICVSPPLSLDGAGDTFVRDSEHVDGGSVSGGDETRHR